MFKTRLLSSVAASAAVVSVLAGPAHAEGAFEEYVALGDSWAADFTLSQGTAEYAPLGCGQSRHNYPKQIAATLHVARFQDASCEGATTNELTSAQTTRDGTNAPQFDRLTPATDLVTLEIGGDDAHLASTVERCLTVNPRATPCQDALVVDGVDQMSANIAAAEPKVVDAIAGIKARSPRARILLIDYFRGAPTEGGCFPVIPISDSDAAWLGRKLIELDRMLARVASSTGVDFVDTYSGSFGHDACQPPGVRWVEGLIPLSINPPGLAVPFHPNQLGADHQTRTVLGYLSGA
ncbi:SGNH/GDSL hydrolase family protein [Nocardia sp. NPDC004068]|uniref:SGNH/GDSL hydrolase family protein n=1 Tax=Nocardia sp. NPDC004068 TaxID=3364303 RepID=UPI0036C14211